MFSSQLMGEEETFPTAQPSPILPAPPGEWSPLRCLDFHGDLMEILAVMCGVPLPERSSSDVERTLMENNLGIYSKFLSPYLLKTNCSFLRTGWKKFLVGFH